MSLTVSFFKASVENVPPSIIFTPNDSRDPSYTKLNEIPYYIICRRRAQKRIRKIREIYGTSFDHKFTRKNLINKCDLDYSPTSFLSVATNVKVPPNLEHRYNELAKNPKRYFQVFPQFAQRQIN